MPLGSLPTLLIPLKSYAACTLHSSREHHGWKLHRHQFREEELSRAGCWLRTPTAAAQLPSADIFPGNLEQITSSPLALVSPFIQGNADDVSQCQCDIVTYHTQILRNGDTINSIATLSDPAVMSLPVWMLLLLIRKHSCSEIPSWEKSKEGLCHVLVSRCLHCSNGAVTHCAVPHRAVPEPLEVCTTDPAEPLLPFCRAWATPAHQPCRSSKELFSCWFFFFFWNSKMMEINDHKPVWKLKKKKKRGFKYA